jgi:hypothetical protein
LFSSVSLNSLAKANPYKKRSNLSSTNHQNFRSPQKDQPPLLDSTIIGAYCIPTSPLGLNEMHMDSPLGVIDIQLTPEKEIGGYLSFPLGIVNPPTKTVHPNKLMKTMGSNFNPVRKTPPFDLINNREYIAIWENNQILVGIPKLPESEKKKETQLESSIRRLIQLDSNKLLNKIEDVSLKAGGSLLTVSVGLNFLSLPLSNLTITIGLFGLGLSLIINKAKSALTYKRSSLDNELSTIRQSHTTFIPLKKILSQLNFSQREITSEEKLYYTNATTQSNFRLNLLRYRNDGPVGVVYEYSNKLHRYIDSLLKGNHCTWANITPSDSQSNYSLAIKECLLHALMIKQGLNEIRKVTVYHGPAYHGDSLTREELDQYKVGRSIIEKGFFKTSPIKNLAFLNTKIDDPLYKKTDLLKPVLFTITINKTGTYIGNHLPNDKDHSIIFTMGTRFDVLSKISKNGITYIELKET